MSSPIATPLTALLGIRHPIVLAGMAAVSGGALAAAVSNAGGLGVVGGFRQTPAQLRETLAELRAALVEPGLPFGVDLALPQVGGGARATNHDYTGGHLDELIDIVVASGACLFVSAVGVPPPAVVARLHAAGILVMNMVGHPRHAAKALAAGVDLLCAQGTEGGGHTGPVAASVLVPAVVDVAAAEGRRRREAEGPRGGEKGGEETTSTAPSPRLPLTTPLVLAAGGIADGRGLAAALMQGAVGVWVGTRFVASDEAACSDAHKQAVVSCGPDDTTVTLVLSGRPLRARSNAYLQQWHAQPARIAALCAQGIVPLEHDLESAADLEDLDVPYLMGQVAGNIADVQPAAAIVEAMVAGAVEQLRQGGRYLGRL